VPSRLSGPSIITKAVPSLAGKYPSPGTSSAKPGGRVTQQRPLASETRPVLGRADVGVGARRIVGVIVGAALGTVTAVAVANGVAVKALETVYGMAVDCATVAAFPFSSSRPLPNIPQPMQRNRSTAIVPQPAPDDLVLGTLRRRAMLRRSLLKASIHSDVV
jgi:hypothetical protein